MPHFPIFRYLCVILATALVLGFWGKAHADPLFGPPAKGYYGLVAVSPSVLCLTSDNVKTLVNVGLVSKGKQNIEKLREMVNTLDKGGNSLCALVRHLGPVAVGESNDLGDSYNADGILMHVWAVHVGNQAGDAWLLYGLDKAKEKVDPAAVTRDSNGVALERGI